VVWGEEEREGREGSEVGSRWEFLASCASGGMSCADWSKVSFTARTLYSAAAVEQMVQSNVLSFRFTAQLPSHGPIPPAAKTLSARTGMQE